MVLDNLSTPGTTVQKQNWSFFTDGVMGGLSQGKAIISNVDGIDCYHMTGNVTTENNGGFIQIRNQLKPAISTKEFEGKIKTYSEQTVLDHKKIFFNRYFSNRKLYSLRNMEFDFETKKIREDEMNDRIKDNNIFGKDLTYLEINDNIIKNKVLSYIFDNSFYCRTIDSHNKYHIDTSYCITDINMVLKILKKPEIRLIKEQKNTYNCNDNLILKNAIEELLSLASKILHNPISQESLLFKIY